MASSVANVKCFLKLLAPQTGCRLSVEWNAFKFAKVQILTPDVYCILRSIRTYTQTHTCIHTHTALSLSSTHIQTHTHTHKYIYQPSICQHNNIFESFLLVLNWPLCPPCLPLGLSIKQMIEWICCSSWGARSAQICHCHCRDIDYGLAGRIPGRLIAQRNNAINQLCPVPNIINIIIGNIISSPASPGARGQPEPIK